MQNVFMKSELEKIADSLEGQFTNASPQLLLLVSPSRPEGIHEH